MKLSFRKTNPKDARIQDDTPGSQDATPSPSLHQKPGFWKSFDWKLMLAMLFPMLLETLDYTVVATAQSQIASTFNALPLGSYIGTLYLLASTAFLPLFASIADIYGRHLGLQLSLLIFLVGNALSTGATNMSMILVGRGIAGIGAAGLLTLVRTVLSDTTSLDENNVQQAILFLLYAVGFNIGPVVGGFLVSVSFRWVFAINLPCTAIAMFLCFVFLRNRYRVRTANDEGEHQAAISTPTANADHTPLATVDTWVSKLALIDWVGTVLFVSGGILVLLALNWGPDDNWKSARVIVNIVLGALLIVLCILWEILLKQQSPSPSSKGAGKSSYIHTRYTGLFRARPMIPIEMFTSYDMCVVQYDSFVSGIVMFVIFYFTAIFATVVTGLSPAQAGVQLLYFASGPAAGSSISTLLIKLFRQPIYPIVLGNVVMTVGIGLIQMAIQRNVQGEVSGYMAIVGAGVGMSAGPVVIYARFVKPNHVAITSALMLFFHAFGGTVGLAQCFTILNAKVNADIASQLSSLTAAGTLTASDIAALASLVNNGGLSSVTSLDGLPSVVQDVVRDAFRDGVRWGFVSLVPWLGVACVASVFLSRIADPDEDKDEDGEGGEGKEKEKEKGGG